MSIRLEQVSFSYDAFAKDKRPNIDNINLQIEDGEFVGIMGPTGSGKTTLLQLFAGLLTPSQGKVFIDDEDIHLSSYPKHYLSQKVGVLFQYPEYQLFETTVERDVAFALKHCRLSKLQQTERVKWALESMGFSYETIKDQSPLALSGGEKRRVAIAGILASKPKTLILDEPIAGLNPFARERFLKLLRSLAEEGITIILISHNADAIAEYAQRLLVLEAGSLLLDDSPKIVFSDLKQMQALHLGVSSANEVAHLLLQRGKNISPSITKYEELLASLKTTMKGSAAHE